MENELENPTFNPLSPDAPLVHLLSLRHNPLLAQMSQDQLTELVKKLRTHATSPPTLTAKLKADAQTLDPKAHLARGEGQHLRLDHPCFAVRAAVDLQRDVS